MIKKNQPVTKEELKEVLRDYPTKDYLEDRLELFEKGIVEELDERMDKKFKIYFKTNFDAFYQRLMKGMGITVVTHEQRITKLEDTVFPTKS